MADDAHREDPADITELVRILRELTMRVQRLEQRFDREIRELSGREYFGKHRQIALREPASRSALESRIGSQWLNRIGVVAVLFGVAYLLRYAFARQWISVATWIWTGVGAGVVIIAGSEWFRAHGYRVLSLSLKATGVGVSYLSLWAGLELYRLVSGKEAFLGLLLLTVLAAVLALRECAETLAGLALIAGFLTPLLISIPSREMPLFLYIALLDVAAAAIALNRSWWKLIVVAFIGTVLLCSGWYFRHYSRTQLTVAVTAATLFFAIFLVTSLWMRKRLPSTEPASLLALLEVSNPVIYYGASYLLLNHVHHNGLAIPAFSLSTLYFALAWKQEGSVGFGPNDRVAVYGAMGILFVAIALAILLPTDWLSLGWFLEAAVVVAIGFWRDLPWLRWGGLLLLGAAVAKAFAYDVWQLSLGYRTLSFIGLGILLLAMSFAYQRYGFSTIGRTGKGIPGRLR